MASDVVGIRLNLTGQRETVSGIRSVNVELGSTQSRLSAVASAGASAARGVAGVAGSGIMSALRGVATGVAAISAAATAVGGAATVSIIKTGVAYNDLEQRSRAAFTTILGSGDAANQMMDRLHTFGMTSPFPRQAFITATQQLLAFGYSADAIIPTLTAINDATAAVGGNAETIATITDVMAQVQSSGKITAEVFNRMGAVGINAADLIGKGMGMTATQVRDSVTDGSLDAGKALTALTDQMERKFAGASDNVKKTWSGAVDRVKGAWRDFSSAMVSPFVATGGGGLAVDWANSLADGLRKAANAAPLLMTLLRTGKTDGKALAGILGPRLTAGLTTAFSNVRQAVLEIVAEVKTFHVGIDGTGTSMDLLVGASQLLLGTVRGVIGLFELLGRGNYTANLAQSFGWAEDSKPVDFLLRVRDGFIGITQALVQGDYSGKLRSAFGWEEDSKPVAALFAIRDAFIAVGGAVAALFTGGGISQAASEFGPLVTAMGGMGGDLATLAPAVFQFHDSVAKLAGGVLTVVGGALSFLADHVGTLVKLMPYLAAAYVAYRVSLIALNAVTAITQYRQLASNLVTIRSMAVTRAHTAALWQQAAAIRGVTVAELQGEVPARVGLLMRIRQTAALVAGRAVALGMAAATRIATAAQWLWNAAMTANPIGLIIAGITLLVGGLIWFFTQTKVGQQVWTVAWGAITGAVKWFVDWATGSAWPAIKSFFGWIGGGIGELVGFIRDHWQLLVAILVGPIGVAVYLIHGHMDAIRAAFSVVVGAVRDAGATLKDWAQNILGRIVGGAVSSAVGIVNGIRDAIDSVTTKVRSAIQAFQDLAAKIKALPGVGAVVDGVQSLVSKIPGFAAGGQFSAGSPIVVGERGPELILPQVDGTVVPNHQLRTLAATPTDAADLAALSAASTGTQVVQLVVDRKVLAETTVAGLNARQARR